MDKHATAPGGLIAAMVEVARNGAGLLLSRLELAALELSEVRNQMLKLLLLAALALLAACFALGCVTALIIFMSWDALGWKILALLALAYAMCAIGLLLWIRRIMAEGRLAMPATMKELQADRDIVTGLV